MLGVTFTNNLKWDRHFNVVTQIFSSKIFALKLLKGVLNKNDLMQVYYSLLSNFLDYAAPLFLNTTDRLNSKANSYIKRAHKIICGMNCCGECLPKFSSRSDRLILPNVKNDRILNSFVLKCAIIYNKELEVKLHKLIGY